MYNKYRAYVNIKLFDVIKSLDLEDLCKTFQCNKSNNIYVCNNFHYNSIIQCKIETNSIFSKIHKNQVLILLIIYLFKSVKRESKE